MSKSNLIIIAILLTILSLIGFGLKKYLENSEIDREIELSKIEDKKLRREADKKIANAPLEPW